MKIACILLVSGQLVALALIGVRSELLGPESGWGDVLEYVALGAYLIAIGAGMVFMVLLVPRLIRGVARVGVLPLLGNLVGMRRYEDAFEDVFDEALGIGAEDERVESSAERVAHLHESSMRARRSRRQS